jgi:N-acetyl-anhydromuramyl-L-alanine amidase AmpD
MIRTLGLICVLSVVAIVSLAATTKPAIIDRLMPLTHSSTRPSGAKIDTIVLHFSSDINAHPDDPYNIDRQIEIYRNARVSAHYLIDRDGTVYRLVDEKRAAWHAGKGVLKWEVSRTGLNSTSVGIEMLAIGSENDMAPLFMSAAKYRAFKEKHANLIGFSDAEYASLKKLIDDIRSRHPDISLDRHHIIGHEEWAGRARRTDPSEAFDWTKIGLKREQE